MNYLSVRNKISNSFILLDRYHQMHWVRCFACSLARFLQQLSSFIGSSWQRVTCDSCMWNLQQKQPIYFHLLPSHSPLQSLLLLHHDSITQLWLIVQSTQLSFTGKSRWTLMSSERTHTHAKCTWDWYAHVRHETAKCHRSSQLDCHSIGL